LTAVVYLIYKSETTESCQSPLHFFCQSGADADKSERLYTPRSDEDPAFDKVESAVQAYIGRKSVFYKVFRTYTFAYNTFDILKRR